MMPFLPVWLPPSLSLIEEHKRLSQLWKSLQSLLWKSISCEQGFLCAHSHAKYVSPHPHFPTSFILFVVPCRYIWDFKTQIFKNTYVQTQAAHYVQTSSTLAGCILQMQMNSKQHYFKWCGSRRVVIRVHLEGAQCLISWLPCKHYVQRFTLLLLLCENDLWLTERSASFLRFHAWRNNKPCFCPADGFLLLLSSLSHLPCWHWKQWFYSPQNTNLPSQQSSFVLVQFFTVCSARGYQSDVSTVKTSCECITQLWF